MYFNLGWKTPDDKISFLLGKNPSSPPFKKDLSGADDGSRIVHGRYVEGSAYEVVVHNDEAKLLKRYRAENLASYVSAAPYAVNPRNLKGVISALKSAVDGKAKGIDATEIARPRALAAIIGPFLAPKHLVIEIYKGLGLHPRHLDVNMPTTQHVGMYALGGLDVEPFPLAEFLRRVFIGAYALSIKDHDEYALQESLVEALIEMSKDWLGQCSGAEQVMRAIARGQKGLLVKFRDAIKDEEVAAEVSDEDAPEEQLEQKISLHVRRHETILKALAGVPLTRVVDLGCGDGGLLARIRASLPEGSPEIPMLAIDADTRRVMRVKRRGKIKARDWNILLPKLTAEELQPTLLLCSEVIEHLGADDRRTLIKQVCEMWRPHFFALTTPNVAYNHVWGLKEGEFRHADHRIEYTREDLEREVLQPLKEGGYIPQVYPVIGFETEPTQPSFVVVASRAQDTTDEVKNTAEQHLRWIGNAYAPFAVEEVGYSIGAPELEEGYKHPVYRHYRQGAFFLSPTMAPVDYNPAFPDVLEHPATALAYYHARGVDDVVVQPKWMGSRAHVLAFRELATAKRAGFERQVTVTSRGGFPFFDKEQLDAVESQVLTDLNWLHADSVQDFVAFDAEVLPWVYKAEGLIRDEFRKPGEAAKLYHAAQGAVPLEVDLYLATLENFAQDQPLELRLFGLLAYGAVTDKGRFAPLVLPTLTFTQSEQHIHLQQWIGADATLLRATPTLSVSSFYGVKQATEYWEAVCASGGEGVVIKPNDPTQLLPDGAPMQPALKVRGPDYLRIIYGMNYRKPENFAQLTRRGTSAKRRVAIQEHALSRRILMTYFKGMHREHAKLVAAFLGMDGLAAPTLDKTL